MSITLTATDVALLSLRGIAEALQESGHVHSARTIRNAITTLSHDDESDPAEWPSWVDDDCWSPTDDGYEPDEQDRASLAVLFPDDPDDDPSYAAWVERMAMSAAWSATFDCIISACNSPDNTEW